MHNDINDLIETAEEIAGSSAPAEIRLTSGMQRPNRDADTFDPAIVGRVLDGDRPETIPTVGAGPRPLVEHRRPYYHSDEISRLHTAVRDATKRRPEDEIGETRAAAKAWADLTKAAEAALAAVADIPAAMGRAEAARAEQLATTDGTPAVLPSTDEARAHAEAHAARLCRDALALAEKHKQVVSDTAAERLEWLSKNAPQQAADVLARVEDLLADAERFRAVVAELVEAAGAEPGRMARRLPTATRLDVLDDIADEVRQLADIAADPSEPAVHPRLEERANIMRRSHGVPGGLTDEVLDLARIERQEAYKITSHTKAIRDEAIENYVAQRVSFGGAYLR